MAGQQDNRMHCAEFDALLSQAIDGTLAGERLTAFEAHSRDCKLCGPLLQEAEAGHTWLKSLAEVEPKSVRKKMKDKAFARSVSRDEMIQGAAELGVDLEEHIAFCIEAMKGIAKQLGL